MAKDIQLESKTLKYSVFSLISFSLIGVACGLLLSSDVILFDGIFSIFGVLTSLATFRISRFIHKKDHFNFPFGKENVEPVVVLFQYLLLSAFLGYTLFDAVRIILSGGNRVQLGSVILYLLLNTLALVVIVKMMRRSAEKSHSTLVESELVQWEISLRQSLFALGSYSFSLVLAIFSYDAILPYIDPAVLVVFVLLTFITVIKEIVAAFKEIIGMRSVNLPLQQSIENHVKTIKEKYHIKDYYLRVNKVGSTIVVEVDFLVDEEFEHGNVYQQDMIREEFKKGLHDIDYDLWLSIAFTTQYKWVT